MTWKQQMFTGYDCFLQWGASTLHHPPPEHLRTLLGQEFPSWPCDFHTENDNFLTATTKEVDPSTWSRCSCVGIMKRGHESFQTTRASHAITGAVKTLCLMEMSWKWAEGWGGGWSAAGWHAGENAIALRGVYRWDGKGKMWAGQMGGAVSPTCSSPLGYLSMESDWAAMAFTAAAAHNGAF